MDITEGRKLLLQNTIWKLQHEIDEHMAELYEADEMFASALNEAIQERSGV